LLIDSVTGATSRLTRSAAPDVSPAWSADGHASAFSSRRDARYDVYIKAVDESTPERFVMGFDGDTFVEDWSGESLIFSI
ncbi:TolB family protein, partial [Salmonella sp. SAL4360]|uniref:TolB family protein n=1 Tax=Salmonella sp. SAL4360 TaxID=3159881 RepID=UPI00397B6991